MGDEDYFRETGYFKINHAQRAREDAERAGQTINRLINESHTETKNLDKARKALERIIKLYGPCTCKKGKKQCIRCVASAELGWHRERSIFDTEEDSKTKRTGYGSRRRKHKRFR